MSTTQPQVTRITIEYHSNYNGCTVHLNFDGEDDDLSSWCGDDVGDKHPESAPKAQALQDAVVERAYEDCIKGGRLEGVFNGDIDDLEDFAVAKAKEIFGNEVPIEFKEDGTSD